MDLSINLEFSGGAELLVGNVKKHTVNLSATKADWDVKSLLQWIKGNLLQERQELFLQGETIRPGIIVLINETDWLLMGQLKYKLENNDTVTFISTLHGG